LLEGEDRDYASRTDLGDFEYSTKSLHLFVAQRVVFYL
jgi:hypothetical protein